MDDYLRSRLALVGARHKAAVAELDETRTELQPVVVEALKAGVKQVEIVRLTGYSRETVRGIARANGIEAR